MAMLTSTAAFGLSPFGFIGNRPSATMSLAVSIDKECKRQYSARGK
ncbi:hypothetical protein D322_3143 [Yersinia enterocolitica IP 10393]|nr:hypothetical protein D322_3143 [Yersinia enterocolitica IP 10393]